MNDLYTNYFSDVVGANNLVANYLLAIYMLRGGRKGRPR